MILFLFLSLCFFFFSSRRRHTRFDCDWSSDVCSSDLDVNVRLSRGGTRRIDDLKCDGDLLRWREDRIARGADFRSEEHTSELQSQSNLVCRLLLEKKKNFRINSTRHCPHCFAALSASA